MWTNYPIKPFGCKIGLHWWTRMTMRDKPHISAELGDNEWERHCIFCGKMEVYRLRFGTSGNRLVGNVEGTPREKFVPPPPIWDGVKSGHSRS